ncbi:MAG TPA: zinc ribbon domain-containing protein [Vicinamibacterales bacterium]|nr:zinc ribbon domain-containing protein [Vicinamibacterales bacterium]
MPVYEFKCHSCGGEFEALVRSHDTAVVCTSCLSRDIERQVSAFAVSSDGTRQRNITQARKDGRKTALDKAKADEEWLHHHDH